MNLTGGEFAPGLVSAAHQPLINGGRHERSTLAVAVRLPWHPRT
jgi:hypothetical protein